jgi:hypothetical protein
MCIGLPIGSVQQGYTLLNMFSIVHCALALAVFKHLECMACFRDDALLTVAYISSTSP